MDATVTQHSWYTVTELVTKKLGFVNSTLSSLTALRDNSRQQSDLSYSDNDTVTISAEGLAAYEKSANVIMQENAIMQEEETRTFKIYQVDDVTDGIKNHSSHYRVGSFALGLDDSVTGTQKIVVAAYEELRMVTEKVDEKISSILKENNIVLSEKETLDLSVNQDGYITAGKSIIDVKKRETLEKILNSDASLGQELLEVHAFRKLAIEGGETGSVTQSYSIFINRILQREYGISLTDLKRTVSDPNKPKSDDKPPQFALKSKDGDANVEAALERLFDEERYLFDRIGAIFIFREYWPEESNFEISFSYRNGVVVEKGKSDAATLDKAADNFMRGADSFSFLSGRDYIITVDDWGIVTDRTLLSVNEGQDLETEQREFSRWVMRGNVAKFTESKVELPCNRYFSQQNLQQYVVDMQRLAQFKNGAKADWNQITFGRIGGKAFTVSTT